MRHPKVGDWITTEEGYLQVNAVSSDEYGYQTVFGDYHLDGWGLIHGVTLRWPGSPLEQIIEDPDELVMLSLRFL